MAVSIKRVGSLFWWKTLGRDVRNYIRVCAICHKYKADLLAPGELLQPLPVLGTIWTYASMDFIKGLPKS